MVRHTRGHEQNVAWAHRSLCRVRDGARGSVGDELSVGTSYRASSGDDPEVCGRLMGERRILTRDNAHVGGDVRWSVEESRVVALERLVFLPSRFDVGG